MSSVQPKVKPGQDQTDSTINPPRYVPPPPPTSQQQQQQLQIVQVPPPAPAPQVQDMLKFRKTEPDRRTAALLQEIAALRDSNRRLAEDNRELRDLCCFLDDDRQKGRKLAREWQRFGRYTASVMRQEVHTYQTKLRELDNRQQELLRDNLELKELCLYLDEERSSRSTCSHCAAVLSTRRDDGDGSSSGTNGEEQPAPQPALPAPPPPVESVDRLPFDDRAMRYLRNLESKVERLEEEKRAMRRELVQLCGEGAAAGGPNRPEAVVRALQVLEMRDRLELADEESSTEMDDCEKALVREMCDVVWRRMEDDRSESRR